MNSTNQPPSRNGEIAPPPGGDGAQGGGLRETVRKLPGLLGKLTASQIEPNCAGQGVIKYSPYEMGVACLILVYLLAAFLFSFWAMADAFHGGSTILGWFRPTAIPSSTPALVSSTEPTASPTATPTAGTDTAATSTTPSSTSKAAEQIPGTNTADTFILLATSAGWLGATISAMRSLCDHYAAPVENASNLTKQEADRFHTQRSIRWVAGPLMGASLALMVFALVQSGVLPFATGQYPQDFNTVTVKNELAAIGFGGLIGLVAKDVIEKLIQVAKSALGVEEPKDKTLLVSPPETSVQFGGKPVRFTVDPDIPVAWTLEPADGATVGCLSNGVFRPLDCAPKDIPESYAIVVRAAAKADPSRSASAILTVNKPA